MEAPPADTAFILEQSFRILSGTIGGTIAGVFLFLFALGKRQPAMGVLAMFCCILLGMALGTIATMLPGVLLWIYLRYKPDIPEPPPVEPRPLATLAATVGLLGFYMALQTVAQIVAAMPSYIDYPGADIQHITTILTERGSLFLLTFNSGWLTLLLLPLLCGSFHSSVLRRRLGIVAFPWRQTLIPFLSSLALVFAIGFFSRDLLDEKSLESIEAMRVGFESPLIFFLTIVIMAPLLEELIFRGYAWSGWVHRFGPFLTALLTSAFFAVIHLQYGLGGMTYIFLLGMLLAWLRFRSGSVIPAIGLHVANNLMNTIYQMWFAVA